MHSCCICWYTTMSACAFISKVTHSEDYATIRRWLNVQPVDRDSMFYDISLHSDSVDINKLARCLRGTADLPAWLTLGFKALATVLNCNWEAILQEKVLFPGLAAIFPLLCLFYFRRESTSHILHKTESCHDQMLRGILSHPHGPDGGSGAVSSGQNMQPSWTSTNPITVSSHLTRAI